MLNYRIDKDEKNSEFISRINPYEFKGDDQVNKINFPQFYYSFQKFYIIVKGLDIPQTSPYPCTKDEKQYSRWEVQSFFYWETDYSDNLKRKAYWEEPDFEDKLRRSGYYDLKAKLDKDAENKTGYWAPRNCLLFGKYFCE
ncbi:MAG: hypothetical protein SFU98_02505 [Leptospiraceae bacterium]|nr:hypothetical protein [Leptospiraceae bacterium]